MDWLYAEGENAPISEYQQRTESLRKQLDPVKARSLYREEIAERFRQIDDWGKQCQAQMNSGVSDEVKLKVDEKFMEATVFVSGLESGLTELRKWQDPQYSLAEVDLRI